MPNASPWPGRLFWMAATLSVSVHLIALVLINGQLAVPALPSSSPMTAVLIALPEPPATPASAAMEPSATKQQPPTRTRRLTLPPVTVSAPEPGGGVQVITREQPTAVADAPIVAVTETAAQPPAPAPPPEPTRNTPEVGAITWEPPRRIRLDYDVRSSLVDGQATYLWRSDRSAGTYAIEGSLEANGFFATMFSGRIDQESKGILVPTGLRPISFSLRRGESQPEIARFDWSKGQIEHQRSRGEHVQPLTPNAQDLQSFIFQFSPEFLRAPTLERISFAITNARKMETYELRVIGREKLLLSIGEIDTIHLRRVTSDPADAYEVWLSSAHNHLPVKIRFMLSGRFQVEQVVTRIEIDP